MLKLKWLKHWRKNNSMWSFCGSPIVLETQMEPSLVEEHHFLALDTKKHWDKNLHCMSQYCTDGQYRTDQQWVLQEGG